MSDVDRPVTATKPPGETDASGSSGDGKITLSLVSHTNVGKTTLARTLLRRDVGEVLDQAHVTEESERFELISVPEGDLVLWDTPGFGDSRRLLERLAKRDRPIVWFLQQTWDRLTDRPLWSSQQAVLNVQEEADVVLYLVNAAEDPEEAGYLTPELDLLTWIGKPLLVLLNQTGSAGSSPPLMAERVEVWRRATARWPVIRDVYALDAFSRGWVQEGLLFE
ncbi:MAG TPA: GTPase, partial [Longimicrobiaceae bacterium]|nr:GTPase [Longimicrobiaceae bacterium]